MFLKRVIIIFFTGLGLTIVSCSAENITPIGSKGVIGEVSTSPTLVVESYSAEEIVSPVIPSPTTGANKVLLEIVPQPRISHAMVFDPVRKVVVLFGGFSRLLDEDVGFYLNDTWEYDGVSWTKVETLISPSPRSGHAMAYDEKRGLVVLFGGSLEGSSSLNDTWEYDGVSWQLRIDLSNSPAKRVDATMSYDPRTETILLFGGYSGFLTNDLWGYDGLTWTKIGSEMVETRLMYSPMFPKMVFGGDVGIVTFIEDSLFSYSSQKWNILSEPSADDDKGLDQIFIFTAFSFDSRRNVFVLFGGQNVSNDTWEFEGNSWNRYRSPPSLVARSEHAMVFDSERNVTILFGGVDEDNNILNDIWEYDDTTWIQR